VKDRFASPLARGARPLIPVRMKPDLVTMPNQSAAARSRALGRSDCSAAAPEAQVRHPVLCVIVDLLVGPQTIVQLQFSATPDMARWPSLTHDPDSAATTTTACWRFTRVR